MENRILEKSPLQGLHWGKNYYVQTGKDSYTLIANRGPLITDMHFYTKDSTGHFMIQVGQIDRLTFLGDPSQEITATFVDCRKESKTFQKLVEIKFTSDPTRHLFIERGIAKMFSGMKNVTVRSEAIWFSSRDNADYKVGNDRILVPVNTPLHEFPAVTINKLPLPNEVLQLILKREQKILKEDKPYSQCFDIVKGQGKKRITISKKN
jgi:dTDP-4-dehydrorhamnose 3,5-epimerase